jgi:hypothetical protein
MVTKTSILIGDNAESCAQELLGNGLITNWQQLAPEHVNASRILVVAFGDEDGYEEALDKVIAFATNSGTVWRHEDYLVYGNPRERTWIPPMN